MLKAVKLRNLVNMMLEEGSCEGFNTQHLDGSYYLQSHYFVGGQIHLRSAEVKFLKQVKHDSSRWLSLRDLIISVYSRCSIPSSTSIIFGIDQRSFYITRAKKCGIKKGSFDDSHPVLGAKV